MAGGTGRTPQRDRSQKRGVGILSRTGSAAAAAAARRARAPMIRIAGEPPPHPPSRPGALVIGVGEGGDGAARRRRAARQTPVGTEPSHDVMSARASFRLSVHVSPYHRPAEERNVAESQVGRCGSMLQVQVHASRIEASTCGCGVPRGERGRQAGRQSGRE